jgi:hypothetical protein
MKAMDGTQPAEISRVAARLPPFWAERPAVWFAQLRRYSLWPASAVRVQNSIISYLSWTNDTPQRWRTSSPPPPQQDPYSKLRSELLKRLSLSREQPARRILTLEEMGDRKPSQFLRHLSSLVPDLMDYFL